MLCLAVYFIFTTLKARSILVKYPTFFRLKFNKNAVLVLLIGKSQRFAFFCKYNLTILTLCLWLLKWSGVWLNHLLRVLNHRAPDYDSMLLKEGVSSNSLLHNYQKSMNQTFFQKYKTIQSLLLGRLNIGFVFFFLVTFLDLLMTFNNKNTQNVLFQQEYLRIWFLWQMHQLVPCVTVIKKFVQKVVKSKEY